MQEQVIGVEVAHAANCIRKRRGHFWEWKILGCHSPKALVRVFSSVVVSEEVKNTRNKAFTLPEKKTSLEVHHIHTKDVSLTYAESIKLFNSFVSSTAGVCCHVRLFDFYVSKLPNGANSREDNSGPNWLQEHWSS